VGTGRGEEARGRGSCDSGGRGPVSGTEGDGTRNGMWVQGDLVCGVWQLVTWHCVSVDVGP
jgi:hypothetical protein